MAQWERRRDQKVHKVPLLLRREERESDVYDPKVVSFGPYHHGKPELQICQDAKHFILQMFIECSSHTREFLIAKVLESIVDARNCYIDGSTDKYTDREFAEMMLLDACFLINYLDIYTRKPAQYVRMFNSLGRLVTSLVRRDIFLLENQIPFQIFMLLINMIYGKNEGEEAVSKFLHRVIWGNYKQQQQHIQDIRQQHPPLHLFEAFRRVLVWDPTPQTRVEIEQEREDFDLKKYHKTFRSAKDLKARGIHFKPSDTKSLKAIHFSSFTLYGQLQLPTWFVSSFSKVFFSNMIAYELCPDTFTEPRVISYINFMKSLVESPADVKELREKRILFTSLGSDEEVVRLYRDINTYGMESTYTFIQVKQKIQMHYDSKAKTWMAQLIHTYFSSPWSIVAWFAAVFLLILTFMQTYFTINPVKEKP